MISSSLLLIAFSLALDAMLVALTFGILLRKRSDWWKYVFLIVGVFGILQGLMPLIGYGVSWIFGSALEQYDHWIAFFLLGFLALKMVHESYAHEEEEEYVLEVRSIGIAGIATSIDALVIGFTYGALRLEPVSSSLIIAIITGFLVAFSLFIGRRVGHIFGSSVELFGACVLFGIGLKILLEHLGYL